MMAMVSTGAPMVLGEYGISARFPVEARVCYGLSGRHAHGFYTRLGDMRAECRTSRDAPAASAIGIWGDYNTAFYDSLGEAFSPDCVTRHPGVDLHRPDGRPFALPGLPSQVCIEDEEDGGFSISVTAMAGNWEGDGGAKVPYLIYRAYLKTQPTTLAVDKAVFARFLDDLVFVPPEPAA